MTPETRDMELNEIIKSSLDPSDYRGADVLSSKKSDMQKRLKSKKKTKKTLYKQPSGGTMSSPSLN